jgi:hypothetical protein
MYPRTEYYLVPIEEWRHLYAAALFRCGRTCRLADPDQIMGSREALGLPQAIQARAHGELIVRAFITPTTVTFTER